MQDEGSTRSIPCPTLSPMPMGKRRPRAKQASMWAATHDLPRSAAQPFYARLNQILDQHSRCPFRRSTLAELQEVLPALSRDQVRTLLRELRRQGRVELRGTTKAARWFPGPKPNSTQS